MKMRRFYSLSGRLCLLTNSMNFFRVSDIETSSLYAKPDYAPLVLLRCRSKYRLYRCRNKSRLWVLPPVLKFPKPYASYVPLVGAVKGYKTVIIMPDSVSEERRKLVKHYGAEVIVVHDGGNIGDAIEELLPPTSFCFVEHKTQISLNILYAFHSINGIAIAIIIFISALFYRFVAWLFSLVGKLIALVERKSITSLTFLDIIVQIIIGK